jgi:LysM repeat protein
LWIFAVCLVIAVTIGGCSREKPMATPTATSEVQEAAVESTPTPSPVSTPVTPETTYYAVQPGDTLWAIARRFEVTVQSLAEANDLLDPERLQPGQELVIPGGGDLVVDEPAPLPPSGTLESQRAHNVATGETLWGIAQRYGTTVDEIAKLNELDAGQVLTVGQRLLIP